MAPAGMPPTAFPSRSAHDSDADEEDAPEPSTLARWRASAGAYARAAAASRDAVLALASLAGGAASDAAAFVEGRGDGEVPARLRRLATLAAAPVSRVEGGEEGRRLDGWPASGPPPPSRARA